MRRTEYDQDTTRRVVAQVGLPFSIHGAAQPHGDIQHAKTAEAGAFKRMGQKSPKEMKNEKGKFSPRLRAVQRFTRRFLRRNFTPLAAEVDISVETWIKNCNYPEWRKIELLAKYVNIKYDKKSISKYARISSFIKDECYDEWKHVRCINSRSDEMKIILGPIFKLIEDQVYQNKYFIKHVPVKDRPRIIHDRLYRPGARYYATDYSSFESSFRKIIFECIEFELYIFMTQNLKIYHIFIHIMFIHISAANVCTFKWFVVVIIATRMSGEMNTSLGNGFTNIILFLFICEEIGVLYVDGFVEGDDGIFVVIGPEIKGEMFEDFGFIIKIIVHTVLSSASFCGIVFDTVDLQTVVDPIKALVKFGWTTRNYAFARESKLKALVRCKAFSYIYQYPGCPLLAELSRTVLRLTKPYHKAAVDIINKGPKFSIYADQFVREMAIKSVSNFNDIANIPIGMNTRLLVDSLYGISVEHQLILEEYFRSLNSFDEIQHPLFELYFTKFQVQYNDKYVFKLDYQSGYQVENPSINFENHKFNLPYDPQKFLYEISVRVK